MSVNTTNETIELGKLNSLRIDRFTPQGAYLQAQNGEDVLLPNQYLQDSMQLDDIVEVFIYTDSEDRLVATTLKPKAMRDEFAFLECVDTASIGAFMDMGLMKDLLVPKNRQKTPIHIGDKRFIRIVKDDRSERLIGVEKITSFLNNNTKYLKVNDVVDILLFAKTPLGFKVIVNNQHEGMIFANEIFEKLYVGMHKKAYIKNIREDGKLDISLQALGDAKNASLEEKVLTLLEQNSGIMPYNTKSDASQISEVFGMSKKNFKAALNALKTAEIIDIKDTGIYLK